MSIVAGIRDSIFEPISWQAEVLARLEERHIVAWGSDAHARTRFAASLQQYLSTQPSMSVCVIHGQVLRSIDDLCDQLERLVPVSKLSRSVDGPWGIASLLRQRCVVPGVGGARSRVFVWNDADMLLRRDPVLFNAVAEAISGVSAELEFDPDDSGLWQRCVYVGSSTLAHEARREGSAFSSWQRHEGERIAFWELVSGLATPPVALCSVDRLLGS